LQSEEVIVIGEGEVPTSTEAKDAMDESEVNYASLIILYD
jgi:hypothetical protein